MNKKRIFLCSICTLFAVLAYIPTALSQMEKIYKFKNVQIPLNLKYEDVVLEKGKYDLEIFKHQAAYYLMIKSKKVSCSIPGELQEYDDRSWTGKMKNPDIPDDPTIKMGKNTAEGKLIIIFESGKKMASYFCKKVRFEIEYEQ